jgi:hypothetical protein
LHILESDATIIVTIGAGDRRYHQLKKAINETI